MKITEKIVNSEDIELSVVIPCLNEAETISLCINKARKAFRSHNIVGEIIVADNGSADGSQNIARSLGAKVVNVKERGYGSALIGGIDQARGRLIIMGDADDSYDFLEIPRFIEKLRLGYDLVQGCRLPIGGGKVEKGAMPWLHRWVGGPFFAFVLWLFFNSPIHDVHCGLRGFKKESYRSLKLKSPGMEFASEMVIKFILNKSKITEIPITLHKDGRKAHPPHLRTFRDGFRHLWLMIRLRWSAGAD